MYIWEFVKSNIYMEEKKIQSICILTNLSLDIYSLMLPGWQISSARILRPLLQNLHYSLPFKIISALFSFSFSLSSSLYLYRNLLAFWFLIWFSTCGIFTDFSSVQSLSYIWFFETPWIAVCQASMCIINTQSLLKLISTESLMQSNHFILCYPLFLLEWGSFPVIQVFASDGQSIGASASATVLQ